MISGQQQLLILAIVECEGELAVELVNEVDAVFFIMVGQDFDVAAGAKRVAFLYQRGAQLPVVVDLAVANNRD